MLSGGTDVQGKGSETRAGRVRGGGQPPSSSQGRTCLLKVVVPHKKKIKGTICPTGLDKRRAPKYLNKDMHYIAFIVQFSLIHTLKCAVKKKKRRRK